MTAETTPYVISFTADTPEPTADITPEPVAEVVAVDPAIQAIRDTLYLDRDSLQLVGFKGVISSSTPSRGKDAPSISSSRTTRQVKSAGRTGCTLRSHI
ncbi:MAG: hypothetical protein R2881_10850 [Eubacteriales bacterium]